MPRVSKLAFRLLVGLLIVWALLLVYPLRINLTRDLLIALPAGVLLCLMGVLCRRKYLRWVPLVIPVALGIFLMLPGRPVDRAGLREAYLNRLQAYKGTRYYWGGEGYFGVDCSGLLRAAMVDAHASQALCTLNPGLARDALWFWWHDASARDLADPARSLAVPLGWKGPMRDVPEDILRAGDFAVTADGSHVLAYVGKGRWIEADPYTLRVIEHEAGKESASSGSQVVPCRWRCFEDPSPRQ
jgi:hypothetical protein